MRRQKVRRDPKRLLGIGLPLLALIAVGPGWIPASGQEEAPDAATNWEKKSYQWFETVGPGGRVRVENPYGNIYARFGGYENRMEILATEQRLDAGLPPLEVARLPVEAGLDVIVRPEPSEEPGAEQPQERRDRVDLVLFVPLGVALEAETREDRIEVKGLKSDLSAASISGDIWIRSIQGRVRARTARGHLTAMLESGVTKEPQELSTETGEIEVHLWEDADLQVEIATSGEISTDFSLEIEHRRFEEPGKIARAKVGAGTAALSLKSKRGRVRLLRMPRHFRPQKN